MKMPIIKTYVYLQGIYLLQMILFFCLSGYAGENMSTNSPKEIKSSHPISVISVSPKYQNVPAQVDHSPEMPAAPVISLLIVPFESRIARLSWSSTDPTLNGTYTVEREIFNSGTWVQLKQLPFSAVLQYNDTLSSPYCKDTLCTYRVSFVSTVAGNNATSNTVNAILHDATPPEDAQDIIVSIVSGVGGTYPEISWKPSPEKDLEEYEISRYNGFQWLVLTSKPADSVHHLDVTVTDACSKSYAYQIVAIDLCENRSAPLSIPRKETIHLVFPEIDECERTAKLSWNPYNLMPGKLGGYRIYRMENYSSPVQIADIKDTTTTAWQDTYSFQNGRFYTYFVEAYSASGPGISTSCAQSWKFSGKSQLDTLYITSVTVEGDKDIRVNYHFSPDSTVQKLVVERSVDGGATFIAIDTLSKPGGYIPKDYYIDDKTADVHSQSYSYRLQALDFCEVPTLHSNISRSILLQCTPSETQNSLDWNSYTSWLYGVDQYSVYRTVDDLPPGGELLGTLNASVLVYSDLLADISPTSKVCYRIEAREIAGNPFASNATSVSNYYCVLKGALVYMPNAFHLGGTNNRFRPVASFVDPQSFTMTIFNRWGQQIFETTDMFNGWDGVVNGQLTPTGIYAYIITYTSLGGQDYTKRGTVYVLR